MNEAKVFVSRFQSKRNDGIRFINEMIEQNYTNHYAYSYENNLDAVYVINAIMFANFSSATPNTEPKWMQDFKLDLPNLQPTTDEIAEDYMRSKF